MADITEIIEESAIQLEIVESGGGQIEIIDVISTQVEVVETTLTSNDVDIAFKTNTLIVESVSDNTNVDISVSSPTTIETSTTTNVIEITENQVVFQTGSVFNIITQNLVNVEGDLTVSENLFVDVIDASTITLEGDGSRNIITVNSGSYTPLIVNQGGLIVFDEFTYTPSPVEGGLLYSGSEFFIGLADS